MVKLESFLVKNTERIIPEINKILSEIPVKPAEILNLFSSRFFSFFNLTLLGFFGRIFTELFNN
jgi:hypothetical protein